MNAYYYLCCMLIWMVVVVEPTQFASSRLDVLKSNIMAVLDAHERCSIKQDGHLLLLDVDEPVDAMYALTNVFGIRSIGIADIADKKLDSLVDAIVSVGKHIIHSNERFHVEVLGSAKGIVTRDVEFAATAALLSELSMLNVKPSSKGYDRLIRVYIADEGAYVCRIYRDGAGGLPVGSNGYALCSVYDCISAVAAYVLAEHGFYPSIIVVYSEDGMLRRVAKKIEVIARMLPRKSIELRYTYYTPRSNDVDSSNKYHYHYKNTVLTSLLLDRLVRVSDMGSKSNNSNSIASSIGSNTSSSNNNNSNSSSSIIALPLSSLHSMDFINSVMRRVSCRNVIFPLMFSNYLLHYSRIFGVDCVREIQDISKSTESIAVDDSYIGEYVEECINNMHTLEVKLSPNMVHDIIDGIRRMQGDNV